VQVRRSGRLGLVERGTAGDVPDHLTRIAARMWTAGLFRCGFHWSPDGARVCRVDLEIRREGDFEHVLLTGRPVEELPHRLSLRELEVLTLLIAGLGNAEIAGQLDISQRTAATHVNHVLQKLGVPTRTAAATYALDAGLLHVPLPGLAEQFTKLSVGRLLASVDAPAVPAPRRQPEAQRRRELIVGAALPLTGKGSEDGQEMLNGLQLAVEEINGSGGIRGRSIRTAVMDIDVTASSSVRTAFESLLRSGVDVLTSGYLAAQDVAHEIAGTSGVPYLHAATSGVMERAVQDDKTRFGRVFQVCASDTNYAPNFVAYMTSLRDRGLLPHGSSRLVVLHKDWRHVDFGIGEATALAERDGWQLESVTVNGPERGDGWARAVLTALRVPPAAIMIGSFFVDDAVQAVATLRVSGAPTLAYSIYAPSVPAFRRQLGEAAEGVLWATMTGTYSDRNGIAFARRYAHRFGRVPGRSHAGLAYDRMQRIALAWRLCGDLSDPDEIGNHLRSQPYRGVNGTYNFDTPGQAAQGFDGEHGDPSMAQPHLIYQIQDGAQVIVRGGPFRTGDFRRPAHLRAPVSGG
jgi:branched-chain amino acid transport system substrate-binding protein